MDALQALDTPAADPGGHDRRSFMKVVTMAAAAVGLGVERRRADGGGGRGRAEAVGHLAALPGVHRLHGVAAAHLAPGLAKLILDLVSLDYHETLLAAAGHQAEGALKAAMKANEGKYVCVIEGAIPTKDDGIYCMIGGRTALEIVNDVAGKAGAIIAIGSCASWGGIPSADPTRPARRARRRC